MKTNFTFSKIRTLAMTFVVALVTLNLAGQTTHTVSVTNFAFTPKSLTITVGDKVVWNNNEGTHNVNGTKATYPSNPESFGNNLGSGWTFEFTFNKTGTYDYQCDPHAAMGMVGKVIVNTKTTSVQKLANGQEPILLYPNPASRFVELKVPGDYEAINSLKVFSITGALVDQKVLSGNSEVVRYDVSQLKNGLYFIEINAGNKKDVLKFLKQ